MATSELAAVYKALAAAQEEMQPVRKDALNPHFRSSYATLSAVQESALPPLHAAGFAVFHQYRDGSVDTVLAHASGVELRFPVPLHVAKGDMQALGSAITYARRYGLLMAAGLAPEDDDGNAAAAAPQKTTTTKAGPEEVKRKLMRTVQDVLVSIDEKFHSWDAVAAWVSQSFDDVMTGADLGKLSLEQINHLHELAKSWKATPTEPETVQF